jgi:hypothetical protein
MRVAQRAPLPIQRLAVQRLRLAQLPLGLQQGRKVGDGGQRVGVRVTHRAPTHLQHLAEQRPRLLKAGHPFQKHRVRGHAPQRLTALLAVLPLRLLHRALQRALCALQLALARVHPRARGRPARFLVHRPVRLLARRPAVRHAITRAALGALVAFYLRAAVAAVEVQHKGARGRQRRRGRRCRGAGGRALRLLAGALVQRPVRALAVLVAVAGDFAGGAAFYSAGLAAVRAGHDRPSRSQLTSSLTTSSCRTEHTDPLHGITSWQTNPRHRPQRSAPIWTHSSW